MKSTISSCYAIDGIIAFCDVFQNVNKLWKGVSINYIYRIHFKIRSLSCVHYSEKRVWIYDILSTSFNVKANENSISRIIKKKFLLFSFFLLLIWLEYETKKYWIFIDICHVIHFSNGNLNEILNSVQTNTFVFKDVFFQYFRYWQNMVIKTVC